MTVIVDVADRHSHAALGSATAVEADAPHNGFVSEAAVRTVHPQLIHFTVIGDIDIDPPIPVHISAGDAEAAARDIDAGLASGVVERPISAVAVEDVQGTFELLRRAVIDVTVWRPAGDAAVIVDIVDDVEIEVAVAVEIDESGGGAPVGSVKTG